MKRWVLLLVVVLIVIAGWRGFQYAYVPTSDKVMSRTRPASGPEPDFGRDAFYGATFGNEVFLTDILGILDGPLRVTELVRAIYDLKGQGTDDLVLPCAMDAVIGGRQFRKGELLHTGIDVPRGSWAPLGMPISFRGGRLRAGITCAACHATVDPESGKVIEGAANLNLNAGLLLAFATNSASFFMHTGVDPNTIPDAAKLEEAVDAALLKWSPGSFDSMVDGVQATTRIPTSWTLGNHPYSWSGAFQIGPYQGLSAQNNNVHSLNSDSLVLADAAPVLFRMPKDQFLTILLRNAALKRFRYDPKSGQSATDFFRSVDPNPSAPGVNEIVVPPTFPKSTYLGPDGTFTSAPGHKFWRHMNAMSVWQNTLRPPVAPGSITAEQAEAGHAAFERAQCAFCHAGRFLTDNKVHPVGEIRTEPARAEALGETELNFGPPVLFSFDEPVPLRSNARVTEIPPDQYDLAQLALAWNHRRTGGGYKTPALIGLYWSAPYLHDGSVAPGRSPSDSLRALIDRDTRKQVIGENAADPNRRANHVSGIGHEFWVPARDQDDLIRWLLTYDPR